MRTYQVAFYFILEKTVMYKPRKTLTLAVAGIGLLATTFSASAVILYDQNATPDVIFGSGNANGSFTVDRANGVELGLRGKLRHNGSGAPESTFNSNGNGTYSFAAGVAPTQSSPTAVWSFEWTINSNFDGNGVNLNWLTYELGMDSDPTLGTRYSTFDPINGGNPGEGGDVLWDHALGTNVTGNGNGVSAGDAAAYGSGIASNNVAQNSWKAHWFLNDYGDFDPTLDGQYDFYLSASDLSGTELARTSMSIIVGQGAASVPEPGTLALLALGLAGFGFGFGKRKKQS
ncbi:MAG: PEP-CTERM sorting domain-containing protein [Desulfobacterales bacterium]|nr:PEP-CTERM sorting domain-containing protein [Desulfobacterales bacterium]